MVPRSYSYGGPKVAAARSFNEKDGAIAPIEKNGKRPLQKRNTTSKVIRTPTALSPPPSVPSQPVVIPTRTSRTARRKSKGQYHRDLEPSVPKDHDRSLLSPSASALLAMTAIPPPPRRKSGFERVSALTSQLEQTSQGGRLELPKGALSSSCPQTWGLLLSPPSEDEVESESVGSDTTVGPFSSVRSMSTESMPSLEGDDEESLCSSSNPATPSLYGANRNGRKSSLSTSKGEDCARDHPLLPAPAIPVNPIPENAELEFGPTELQPTASKPKFSFKSNLTASFRAVRSAARSFSNFAVPPSNLHRDDLLSESLLSLSLPYAFERRPLPSETPPNPALRRYLNPVHLSPIELHFHGDSANQVAVKTSIQLQSYQRGTRLSEHASAPPVFLSDRKSQQHSLGKDALNTEDAFTTSPLAPRQREPRENADFLRMIVLEMNMRKNGKLARTDPGRARLWLPARQAGRVSPRLVVSDVDGGGETNEASSSSSISPQKQTEDGSIRQEQTGSSQRADDVWTRDQLQMRKVGHPSSVPSRWTAMNA